MAARLDNAIAPRDGARRQAPTERSARSRLTWLAVLVYTVNVTAIVAAIVSGYHKGDLAVRFQEKQSITFFSSNQLAMTALLGALIYLLHRHVLRRPARSVRFWPLSSLAFFFLMLDESFQFHEGIDSRLVEAFGSEEENPRLDGLSTALYGLGALAVCWAFRADVTRFRATLVFFSVGAAFLAVTSALNFGEAPAWRVVAEEACKLLGVCSFLLGYLAAFLGTLAEVRDRVPAAAALTPGAGSSATGSAPAESRTAPSWRAAAPSRPRSMPRGR